MLNNHVELFKSVLSTLDCSNSMIKTGSDTFFELVQEDLEYTTDLIQLIFYYMHQDETLNLAYIYLINEIVLKFTKHSAEQLLTEVEDFANIDSKNNEVISKVLELVTVVCKSSMMNDKSRRELERIISIWVDKKVFKSNEVLYDIKLSLAQGLTEPLSDLNDPIFTKLIKQGKYSVPDKIKENLGYLDNISKFNHLKDKHKGNDEDQEKFETLEIKYKENLYKNYFGIVNDIMDTYKRHTLDLQEIDGLIAKLNMIK